jgi:catechol 2,3-dioxygenase-like lactoylglutathione lyase family enzyme
VAEGEPVGAVHHLALRVADVQRALGFYAGLLGLPEQRRFNEPDGRLRSAWLQAGSLVLMLEQELRGNGPEAGSGHVLAFAVRDLPSWERRLVQAGFAVADRTDHTLFVSDPDGHRVGLSDFSFEAARTR